MVKNGFLHCHSTYSLYDSPVLPNELVKKAKDMGAQFVTLTDHGTMLGIEPFMQAGKEFGINTIPGVEVYLENREHFILLAKNYDGYLSISHAMRDANWVEVKMGETKKTYALIPPEVLESFRGNTNVIATSACVAGPISKILLHDVKIDRKLNHYYQKEGLSDLKSAAKEYQAAAKGYKNAGQEIKDNKTEISQLKKYTTKSFAKKIEKERANTCQMSLFEDSAESKVKSMENLRDTAIDRIRDQLQYERTNEERIFQRATDSKDTLYIVDADGRTAEFHGFYGEFKGPEFGDRKLVKRDSPELPMVYGLMRQPVDLTRKEFEKYKSLNADERKKFLADIEKEHGRPQVSKDEARIMKAHEKDRSLIEQKLTLENPVQSYMEMHITNNEIRMGEFGDMARDNWEDIHDDIESFKEDPTLLNDARARQQAFIVKEEEKTPEDDLREEQFFSGHYEERDDREEDEREQSYHEDYLDVVDKDRNGIPDDMEDHDQYEEER